MEGVIDFHFYAHAGMVHINDDINEMSYDIKIKAFLVWKVNHYFCVLPEVSWATLVFQWGV